MNAGAFLSCVLLWTDRAIQVAAASAQFNTLFDRLKNFREGRRRQKNLRKGKHSKTLPPPTPLQKLKEARSITLPPLSPANLLRASSSLRSAAVIHCSSLSQCHGSLFSHTGAIFLLNSYCSNECGSFLFKYCHTVKPGNTSNPPPARNKTKLPPPPSVRRYGARGCLTASS